MIKFKKIVKYGESNKVINIGSIGKIQLTQYIV